MYFRVWVLYRIDFAIANENRVYFRPGLYIALIILSQMKIFLYIRCPMDYIRFIFDLCSIFRIGFRFLNMVKTQ